MVILHGLFTVPTGSWHQILRFGEPHPVRSVASYSNHVVGYDAGRKVPSWVIEHINKTTIKVSW